MFVYTYFDNKGNTLTKLSVLQLDSKITFCQKMEIPGFLLYTLIFQFPPAKCKTDLNNGDMATIQKKVHIRM